MSQVKPRIEYKTVAGVEGPLVILDNVKSPKFGEIVNLTLADGSVRQGQVLEINKKRAVVQVFEGTTGVDNTNTSIEFSDSVLKMAISDEMMGRQFDGSGNPIDKGPQQCLFSAFMILLT